MTSFTVGHMIGSLAKGSINRKLAGALIRLAPPELAFREIPIGDLPLYSYDYDADYPPAGRALKDRSASVDAVLFITSGVQPVDSRRAQERDRLGSPPWARTPCAENLCRDRHFTGKIGTAVGQQHVRSIMPSATSPMFNAIGHTSSSRPA